MTDATPQLLLTPRATAQALSISEKHLRNITEPNGNLPAVKIGKRGIRYSLSDLEAWIDKQRSSDAAMRE